MKKLIYLGLAVLLVSGLSACDSYNYYIAARNKTNMSGYHSFAWMPMGNNGKSMTANGEADARIRDAATAALQSKGLTLRQRRPDLLVSYASMVGRGTKTTYYSSWGSPWGWGGPWGYGWGGGFGWGYRPYYFAYGLGAWPYAYDGEVTYADKEHYKEGTLIIDLIDRRTHKLVWRGYGVGEVHHDPKKNVDDIPKVVDGILQQLNIAPASTMRSMSS